MEQNYGTYPMTILIQSVLLGNIDRIANTASDDACNRVTTLNEFIQCRDGCLSF